MTVSLWEQVANNDFSSSAAFMARARELNLHSVETIGVENIVAGRVLLAAGAPVAMVLVHGKVRAGGVDVMVRSADRDLSASVAALLQASLKA
jgi:hypothetical protein